MDSHSRSASPREPSRPLHRPPSPPVTPSPPAAFDNKAYQHDESDPNHNDSFASNPPQQNGHSKEPNGDTKTLEAVNLELINLTPKNGSAKQKKDVEVDMNSSNPYDEYFVPVNEHRKYMRGEKLYVTADKRGEKGGCKRPLCWTLLGLVVAAVVAIIVLAATGILFTNSPTPVEQYNASVSSARALGGIGHVHSHDHGHDHDHGHEHHDHAHEHEPDSNQDDLAYPTQHPIETQSDEGQDLSVDSHENGDNSMYVPRTMEGELKIDNEEFNNALSDPESDEYREFTNAFSEALKKALFDKNTLDNGDNDIVIEVVNLRKGSVIVKYRIQWKPKNNARTNEDLLTANKLKSNLSRYLEMNNRMISIYHVAQGDITTQPVLDLCQINKNDCEYGCEFDDITLDFICTCPHGEILNAEDPKRCVSILDNPVGMVDSSPKQSKTINFETTTSTIKPMPEDEISNVEKLHSAVGENVFDWKESHHIIPETTTENDADLNFSHIFGHPERKPETTTKPDSEHEREPQPEPNPIPTPGPEPAAEPKPVIPEAEPTAEPDSTTISEMSGEPVLTAEPEPTTKPEPTAEPKADSDILEQLPPEPTAEPKAESESHVQPTPEPEPAAENKSEQQPTLYPTPEPEPTSLSPSDMEHIEPKLLQHSIEAETEPIAESITESNKVEHTIKNKDEQPSIAGPEPTSESYLMIEAENATPHSTTEPQLISDSEYTRTTKIEHLHEFEPKTETVAETEKHSEEEMNQDTTQHNELNQSENPMLIFNEHKYNYKTNDEDVIHETTTTKILTIEPTEPQSDLKLDMVTNFNDDELLKSIVKANESYNNEWFEKSSDMDDNTEHKNDDEKHTVIKQEINRNYNQWEHKSIHTFDSDFVTETTTPTAGFNGTDDDISFAFISKDNDVPTKDTPKEVIDDDEKSITMTILSPVNETSQENESMNIALNNNISSTTTELPMITTLSDYLENDNIDHSTIKENKLEDKRSMSNPSISDEMKIINNKEESTTLSDIEVTTKSANINNYVSVQDNKFLVNGLNKNNHETKVNKELDEGMDITFDNMLYNRSSKAIENESSRTEPNHILLDTTTQDTTDSDWLTENVTEVNYDESINKLSTHETTEMYKNKIDEVINKNLAKDDFEPDYLNNMGSSNNKMSTEQDEPLYGMIHDYDNEDSRIKRVNKELKPTTEMMSAILPVETTTVTQYIYKSAERSISKTISESHNESMSTNTTSTSAEPAPVWEESEQEKDLTVKELPKNTYKKETITLTVPTDNMIPATTITTTSIPLIMHNESHENITDIKVTENDIQNNTKVNNLNVTIYEIATHNTNHSFSVAKSGNPNSAEYEDHETEMNPFLPEIENNKSLVKKLIEGHDLEPNNLNETQNENTEEHVHSRTSEERITSNNETQTILSVEREQTQISTTDDDTLFNELLTESQEESESNKSTTINTTTESTQENIIKKGIAQMTNNKDILPISTFLLDTEDLDTEKDHIMDVKSDNHTTSTQEQPEKMASKVIEDDDSDYLSVVPIAPESSEETLKKDTSEEIQKLNDISDSPKKSDRRTLDATKFETVINNEA